jgi:hypothetical protein
VCAQALAVSHVNSSDAASAAGRTSTSAYPLQLDFLLDLV